MSELKALTPNLKVMEEVEVIVLKVAFIPQKCAVDPKFLFPDVQNVELKKVK